MQYWDNLVSILRSTQPQFSPEWVKTWVCSSPQILRPTFSRRKRKKRPEISRFQVFYGCGGRTRTCGLRVMSPTSCQLLHAAIYDCSVMVPVTGLEPVRCRQQGILSPQCLPFHHTGAYRHKLRYHTEVLLSSTIFCRFHADGEVFPVLRSIIHSARAITPPPTTISSR